MYPSIQAPLPAFPVAAFRAVRRSLPQLMLATITAGLAAFVAQSWFAPRFEAEATLTLAQSSDPAAAVAGHIRGLEAPGRILAVAKEQDLQRWPDFSRPEGTSALLTQLGLARQRPNQPPTTEPVSDARLLSHISRRLEIVPGKDHGSIMVRMTASDPAKGAKFINRLIGSYLETVTTDAVPLQVTQWAEATQRPVYPRKGATAMIGMAVVLLLGLIGIVGREALRRLLRRAPPPVEPSIQIAPSPLSSSAARFMHIDSVPAASEKLIALATMDHGFRSIVAGESPSIDPTHDALQLATELSRAGRQVVLVRWALDGGDVVSGRVRPGMQGVNDLMQGTATFEDIIKRLPDCQVHGIPAGMPVTDRAAVLDPDRLNLVLDTLDEVYDHIVVVAGYADAQALFVALEGRFDACVSVSDEDEDLEDPADSFQAFLGYEVTDIDIIHLHRPSRSIPRRRMRMAASHVA